MKVLNAFEVEADGRVLDYRVGGTLDISRVEGFFRKRYTVRKLWNAGRHVLGILSRSGHNVFLKLATSEGISVLTKNEYRWNEWLHAQSPPGTVPFRVPENIEEGYYQDHLYFLITDILDGSLLVPGPGRGLPLAEVSASLPDIIRFSEFIQELPVPSESGDMGHRELFLSKVRAWYAAIPREVRATFNVVRLLDMAETEDVFLPSGPRHGDFAPWHIMKLTDGRLGLIDGEHFLPNGVRYYDIGYFLQRVHAVLDAPHIAEDLFDMLLTREYDKRALRIVLASRAIGGFLDASLESVPEYGRAQAFADWVTAL